MCREFHHLQVPDKIIQAILRHSNVSVTQRCYIKTITSDVREAMARLECATNVQLKDKAAAEREVGP